MERAKRIREDRKLDGTIKKPLDEHKRKFINRVAKRHSVKTFQRTNAAIIRDLRDISKKLK